VSAGATSIYHSPSAAGFSAWALPGIGEIQAGADLGAIIVQALHAARLPLQAGDLLVVAQKIVSKSEGRAFSLDAVSVGAHAQDLAAASGKDARLVQLILDESEHVVRVKPGVIIVRHRLGLVMAQAGIDRSNCGADRALLLPLAPDASAAQLRAGIAALTGTAPGVIISDSFGRPWRLGTTNVAIGAAGVPSLWDRRGEADRDGRTLEATVIGWADAVAAAAGLVMGEGAEGTPVVLLRGLHCPAPEAPASALIRPHDEDLFT